ncbi:MAG: sugar phosphate isomerase/epimerase [Deinococcota bacterium]
MKTPLAVQLYTLRHLSDDPRDLAKLVAEVGYTGVEGVYSQDVAAEDLKAVLDELNLTMTSAHVPLDQLESNLDDATRYQKALGNTTIILPWISDSIYDQNAATWQALGERFNAIADACEAQGCNFMYHHHNFEMVELDGKLGLEHMLDAGDKVGLELDTGWCAVAGVDPLMLLDKYSGRITRMHVKDRAPEGENADEDGWADVGHGTLDFAKILPAAEAAGVEWFIVEHDTPKDPRRTIERSLASLQAM